jgi:hypothetical protein
MSIDFNDKGKYFTDIISKTPIPALIQTSTHRIEGIVHVRVNERIKAELDRSEELFLAVTEAKIFAADGSILFQIPFIALARSQIVWVIPTETAEVSGDKQ